MIQIGLIALVALTFSILATPLLRRAALRVGVVAVPRARDLHVAPVPLLGGAAIYGGFVAALLLFGDRFYIRELVAILIGATLISLFGLADDRWGLGALAKLGGQLLAGVVLVLGGTQVHLAAQPWLNWALTIIWVVGITNALNFLDNMDGLSGGVATIAAAFFLLLAAMNTPRQVLVGAMAAALIGACVGFLRYNLNPATIFMGDTGSLFLGFVLAALAIKLRFMANTPLVTWMVPVCVLALPIFDTALVLVSRLRRGVNPFTTAGKDHLSHRLHALGMTRREAVLTCYLMAGACGLVGVYLTQARPLEAYVVGGALAATGVAAIIWLERVCPSGQRGRPMP
ncbi:MAG: undecaprenyl/decaprenyl-phosphate alpha-N-acetylglucosaminyl 1-phosphate transferase [Chloroflexi bacterium]|nr:undecaprenyl/decaprenyl-phosphate alpha-N-acetylglucosaminyl 1-phosphate transferase [Chloroflexota bacterium]